MSDQDDLAAQRERWRLEDAQKLETRRKLRRELRSRGLLGLDAAEPETPPEVADPPEWTPLDLEQGGRPTLEARRRQILADAPPDELHELHPAPEPETRGDSEDAAAEAQEREVRAKRSDAASLGERLLRGRVDGAKAGRHQSGPCPYGYRRAGRAPAKTLEPDPIEAEIVRLIFREYLRCRSMKRLVGLLTSMGSKTRKGCAWSRAAVAWILKNDVYVGRVHFGPVKTRGLHVPLIAQIIFNKTQVLIKKNDKRARAPNGIPCEHGVAKRSTCALCRKASHQRWLDKNRPRRGG